MGIHIQINVTGSLVTDIFMSTVIETVEDG